MPVVETEIAQGRVRGLGERGVRIFRGLPYAAPPVGAMRFARPRPPAGWSGARDATRAAEASLQSANLPEWLDRWLGSDRAGVGEASLHLNVHAPERRDGPLPVMVWVHGGGFTSGSGAFGLYRAERLARRGGVVVVTINYRLGVMGALDLRAFGVDAPEGDPEAPTCNAALWDVIGALRWVRENIAVFGGDPARVTLFGQSAGAMAIGALLSAPAARGLFERAILQSGAADNVHDEAEAERVAAALLEMLGVTSRGADLVAELRALPGSTLLRAQREVSLRHRLPLGQLAWQPVLDDALFERGQAHALGAPRVPLLIGTTAEEWKLYTATDAKRRNLDRDTLRAYLARTLAEHGANFDGRDDEVVALYGRGPGGRERTPGEIWAAFQPARVFRGPAIGLARRARAAGQPVHVYRFDQAPWSLKRRLGACHAIELPYVFGTLEDSPLRVVMGTTPGAIALGRATQSAWAAFAHGQSPSGTRLPDWPTWDPEAGATMVLDRRSHLRSDCDETVLSFWNV